MKRVILLVLCLNVLNYGYSNSFKSVYFNLNKLSSSIESSNGIHFDPLLISGQKNNVSIDLYDTVVFDLSQIIITGNTIDLPVSIISDDTINSLDFSLKYDQSKFIYDSIIDLTTYLQAVSFYNTNDSTIRFTSNSFQQYTTNTPLVYIRFTTLVGSSINAVDLINVKAYLNGIKCSIKLINPLTSGLIDNNLKDKSPIIYPNPVSDQLNIRVEKQTELSIVDLSGKKVYTNLNLLPNSPEIINTSEFSKGIYFMHFKDKYSESIQKLIIE